MRTATLALLLLLFGPLLRAAETPSPALLVLSKGDRALMIVDPATLQVVAQVPSGPDPHKIIASADGKRAYISNYGGGSFHTITVVDLVRQQALPVIELGPLTGPHGLDFAGGKLWFTAEGAKVVGSYDPSANQVDWVLGTGQDRTHMIFIWPDLSRIVTSNIGSASITVIERSERRPGPGGPPRVDWQETNIAAGRGVEGFDVAPGGAQIWAANAQDGTVSIIDTASKKVLQTLDANVRGANRLKFTPDLKHVLVSSLGGPDLVIFDAAARAEVKRVRLGRGAAGILMQPDGARAFVACTPDSYVAIVDLQKLEVTGRLQAGRQPDGLAWAVRR